MRKAETLDGLWGAWYYSSPRCGVEQWQLVGLITRRSVVRIHSPLLKPRDTRKGVVFFQCLNTIAPSLRSGVQAKGMISTPRTVKKRHQNNLVFCFIGQWFPSPLHFPDKSDQGAQFAKFRGAMRRDDIESNPLPAT